LIQHIQQGRRLIFRIGWKDCEVPELARLLTEDMAKTNRGHFMIPTGFPEEMPASLLACGGAAFKYQGWIVGTGPDFFGFKKLDGQAGDFFASIDGRRTAIKQVKVCPVDRVKGILGFVQPQGKLIKHEAPKPDKVHDPLPFRFPMHAAMIVKICQAKAGT